MSATEASPWTIPLADGPVATWLDRTIAVLFATAAIALAVLLLGISPDARGHGTHEQLGMAACGWPLAYGTPCPTCGCTTAACQLVHGDVFGAFVTQPFGATMALAGLLLGVHGIVCLLRRRSFVDLWVRLPFWKMMFGAVLLLFAAWGYKCLVWDG